MKIGLFGFTFGHENMGCQALTCAFLEIIQRNLPNEKIEIVDFHSERTLGKIPELFPEMSFSQCLVKLKSLNPEFLKEVKKCDIVFDETYGDGFSDIYFSKSVYKSAIVKYLCARTKVPFILTPQTYGPFKRKSLELLAGKAIKKSTYVFARDEISAKYAAKISGRKDVKTVTDMAFVLSYHKEPHETVRKLGLNISGLLWQGGFDGNQNQFGLKTNYKEYCQKVFEYAREHGYEVHLISHVTKPHDKVRQVPDSDYLACQEFKKLNPQTILAPCFDSPYDVKNYIADMDIFIGGRMHATIGAFSSDVVTIPFAYSRKFKGLYNNLSYSYIVDGVKLSTEKAVEKTAEFIENSKKLSDAQKKSMDLVRGNIADFEKDLKDILMKIN